MLSYGWAPMLLGPYFAVEEEELLGLENENARLKTWIDKNPGVLGDKVFDKWNTNLPFLFQVSIFVVLNSISLSADHDDEEEVSTSKFKDMLVLGLLFGLWNIFNIYFNIYNKQVLGWEEV